MKISINKSINQRKKMVKKGEDIDAKIEVTYANDLGRIKKVQYHFWDCGTNGVGDLTKARLFAIASVSNDKRRKLTYILKIKVQFPDTKNNNGIGFSDGYTEWTSTILKNTQSFVHTNRSVRIE